ncbi:gamma-butyrobetaine dioxygenase [Amyelois transitella]|uniref:gamma-butyrobetaine dioxygenase n=1 Tax=Amyelois transitella TaxID=680683 RepID=UPI00298F7E2D|nr:gamma-butyrobetaine dioxygenase [Amyelois transitella]
MIPLYLNKAHDVIHISCCLLCKYQNNASHSSLSRKANMFISKRVQSARLLNQVIALKNLQQNRLKSHNNENFLNVKINGDQLKFPFVWLRDNCQCDNCFHQTAKSRILDWSRFETDIKPKYVEENADSVKVEWSDAHVSRYKLNWLKFRSFTDKNQQRYKEEIYQPTKITWKGDQFDDICSRHDYTEILQSDKALHEYLHKLSVYGVALIQNAPNSETAIDAVVARIGFTKQTHYGVKFIVQHVVNTSNVAYLSSNLQMHTDLPYYEYCPGTNLLHCLVQTKSAGGENLLSDCHYIASYMKENHPEEYRLLTETEVEWSDIGVEHGNEFFKLHRGPVICLDKHGEINRINFSIPQRGSHFPGPIEVVEPWYKAHGLFLQLNHKFSAKFKTTDGDILAFDNIRLLHGRNAYEDNTNNVRKLIGAYIDWDEIYSRLRCLKVKINKLDGIY